LFSVMAFKLLPLRASTISFRIWGAFVFIV